VSVDDDHNNNNNNNNDHNARQPTTTTSTSTPTPTATPTPPTPVELQPVQEAAYQYQQYQSNQNLNQSPNQKPQSIEMDDTQHFCLRWNNYQSSITSAFENLRDDEAFVDVTLACEGRSIKAHRVVLSACSPYFRELLKVSANL